MQPDIEINICDIFLHRKVRSRSNQRYTNQQTDEADKLQCRYVSLWLCIIISSAWLLVLSYIVAVIHAEHNRLVKDTEHCKYSVFAIFRFNDVEHDVKTRRNDESLVTISEHFNVKCVPIDCVYYVYCRESRTLHSFRISQ